jgi:hypothetical protein
MGDDPYNPTTCTQKLTESKLLPICDQLPGAPYHCDDLLNQDAQMHKWCAEHAQMYTPVQSPACIKKDANGKIIAYRYFLPDDVLDGCNDLHLADKSWKLGKCYCCCSCFAYGTLISMPTGVRMIQNIKAGEQVLTAKVQIEGGQPKLTWQPQAVTFSDGAKNESMIHMVYLSYGESDKIGDMVCTLDQVFMLASGKLITAERLQIGDMLIDREGAPVPVRSIAVGSYKGGVHHIGTTTPQDISVDGHLLLAGGVVAGDYYLQLYFDSLPHDVKAGEALDRPLLGTPAYDAAHHTLRKSATVHFGDSATGDTHRIEQQSGTFTFYSKTQDPYLQGGASLFTYDQAMQILENGVQLPLSNPVPKSAVDHLFKLFQGFYPEYHYYLDWYQMEPNVYAVERYGMKMVVVSGGLARLQNLQYDGLAMAIASGIARFSAIEPRGVNGFAGTGAADFEAFGGVSRTIWWGDEWIDHVNEGYLQLKSAFKLITGPSAKGNPADPINEPSVDCRLKAMQSGVGNGAIPACCGGPATPEIALRRVDLEETGVKLVLSLGVTKETATDVANYLLDPAVVITAAALDETYDFVIHLTTALAKEMSYTVTIQNLKSTAGSGINPVHNSLPFSTK